jgi:pilus assembly protein CpaE
VRVLVAGKLDEYLGTHLRQRDDFTIVEPGVEDGARPEKPDVVLYVAQDRRSLENDVAVLRSWTQAPIVLAIEAPTDGLIDDALRLKLADVVVLPQSVEAIAFALRKTALAGTDPAGARGRIVTIFSPKGGTGKTVLATNLAVMLRRSGRRTLLVDLDLQFGDAAMMIGVVPSVTIHDLALDHGELDADKLAGFVTKHESGLAVLAAPLRPEEADGINDQRISRLLNVAATAFDVVVVDTSPQFDAALLTALECSDEPLLVTVPEVTALKNVRVSLRTLDRLSVDLDRLSLVLNRAGMKGGLSERDVSHALERPVRFAVPEDVAVPHALNRGVPADSIDPESGFSSALGAICQAISASGDESRNGSNEDAPRSLVQRVGSIGARREPGASRMRLGGRK